MALLSDVFHKEKLNKKGINIKTKYIVGNKILERNSDNSINDDVVKGIRCEKNYYLNNQLVHTEKLFDSRMEYSFIVKDELEKDYTCANCGISAKVKDFTSGCPYCKTYYNIDYTDKELGSKHHYDLVLKSNTYRIVTAIVDLVISTILSFFFITITSRTFNEFDIIKIFIYGLILSMILYYAFYLLDAYIVLGPIKRYKEKQNQRQKEFWDRTKFDKKHFFNNLNYEVRKYYYSQENIIDYDVLDYLEFKDYTEKDNLYVEVTAQVRIVTYENGKIKSKIKEDKYIVMKNKEGSLELNKGTNMIKCPSCGASISAIEGSCSYCNYEIKYLQDWILVNNQ